MTMSPEMPEKPVELHRATRRPCHLLELHGAPHTEATHAIGQFHPSACRRAQPSVNRSHVVTGLAVGSPDG